MKQKQLDILGVEPEIGDTIVFNPPRYSGLISGKCMGFSASGLPEVDTDLVRRSAKNKSGYYTPKTGFVVCKA